MFASNFIPCNLDACHTRGSHQSLELSFTSHLRPNRKSKAAVTMIIASDPVHELWRNDYYATIRARYVPLPLLLLLLLHSRHYTQTGNESPDNPILPNYIPHSLPGCPDDPGKVPSIKRRFHPWEGRHTRDHLSRARKRGGQLEFKQSDERRGGGGGGGATATGAIKKSAVYIIGEAGGVAHLAVRHCLSTGSGGRATPTRRDEYHIIVLEFTSSLCLLEVVPSPSPSLPSPPPQN